MGKFKDTYIRQHGEQAWHLYNKNKAVSLHTYILKYGEEEGTIKWDDLRKSKAFTLENQIKKYGVSEGTARFELKRNHDKIKMTLPNYILKFGEEDGTKRYKEKNSHLSVGVHTLKEQGYSEEQIITIRSQHAKKSAITLENQIERYGVDDGTKRWEAWKNKSKHRSHWCIEFWVNRGYTIDEAKGFIKELQATSTLEKFIKRYGVDEGTSRYLDVNKRKTSNVRYASGSVSKIEQLFFNELSKITYVDIEKGRTCQICTDRHTYYCDYFDAEKNKIVEFYGQFWHMKPAYFKASDINKVNKKTAEEIWEADKRRITDLECLGYKTLIIWEDDVNKEFEKILQQTKEFLEG